MGGSNTRMEKFTKKVARELNVSIPVGSGIVDLSVTDRYSMFKAGPMLAVSVCIVFAHEARMPVLLPSAFLRRLSTLLNQVGPR
jgi:hypothetical protein